MYYVCDKTGLIIGTSVLENTWLTHLVNKIAELCNFMHDYVTECIVPTSLIFSHICNNYTCMYNYCGLCIREILMIVQCHWMDTPLD